MLKGVNKKQKDFNLDDFGDNLIISIFSGIFILILVSSIYMAPENFFGDTYGKLTGFSVSSGNLYSIQKVSYSNGVGNIKINALTNFSNILPPSELADVSTTFLLYSGVYTANDDNANDYAYTTWVGSEEQTYSDYIVQEGDILSFYEYVPDWNEIKNSSRKFPACGIEIDFTDGTYLRPNHIDKQNIVSTFGNWTFKNKWLKREVNISDRAGKMIKTIDLVQEVDRSADETFWCLYDGITIGPVAQASDYSDDSADDVEENNSEFSDYYNESELPDDYNDYSGDYFDDNGSYEENYSDFYSEGSDLTDSEQENNEFTSEDDESNNYNLIVCPPLAEGVAGISGGSRIKDETDLDAFGEPRVKYCNPSTGQYNLVSKLGEFCAEDYECISNLCLDSVCTSVSDMLREQQGTLNKIWCALSNFGAFVSRPKECTTCEIEKNSYCRTCVLFCGQVEG